MSDAKVEFETLDYDAADPGKEQRFGFKCPKRGHMCGALVIADRTELKRDGQNQNGGIASPTYEAPVNR